MNQETWSNVDHYLADRLVGTDRALEAALESIVKEGLPTISVSPTQGKLLHLLAQTQGARSILEIGTLGGYSTIWLARSLPPGGRLITLEADPGHAEVARRNIEAAGLADRVELRLGLALDTLPLLAGEGKAPFDFVFIDADKERIAEYFTWSLELTRPGSLIVVDNIVRKGGVIDAASDDPRIIGVRRFLERLASEPRVSASAIQTVGEKGYDGFAIARVV